ncbi:2-amino-4-hydroxy-6-hydroxymethyldihydropteridine diphosphokinase [Bathymodiolus japonicus methanotrophic gill symbiont]|uniref:2-amino-4-hydroxy-6- hydroxymethyldihydropteridine diphosphokinase n=1 Tax=Bathymodiolus japonicus methanotrophic gill symbiont TaxID=113269 RepID=UPI001B40F861|nr:2-amino-4-hydroxy-6-hydroxymethyldihydropteridine diphosphokinase [Bathymodiolus japonicus methanotrophic gill symbiont]GFO72305.1 2-amino-4-hydroxy-6-hydroxymethyldihydropteridine diphosphokinase [Bathymodiolus japonicus methanotrophic gill symbiont]
MPLCFISIGSNINPEHNIPSALEILQCKFGSLTYSSVYESAAVGFAGDAFLNLVISFYSEHDPVHISLQLKNIEAEHDRVRTEKKFSSRTLDLDLLLYDQEIITTEALTIPHKDILDYAFVLEPLAEIAPERHHPVKDVCFDKLWQEFDKSKAAQQKIEHLSGKISLAE